MLKKLNSYDHELSLRWALCARFNSPYLFLRKFVFALEFSGSGYVWIPYSIIMIGIYYTSIEKAIRYILLFTGLLFDIAIIGTTKGLTRRSRPVVNHDDVLSIGPDKYSFPSGHTSRAVFLLFYFIQTNFFQNIPVLIIIIWLSSVVASRVLLGRHYISDVVAGIFFGIFECSVILHISPLVTQLIFSMFGVPQK
jgi:membrane-associated phospholipid phosphatase